MSKASKAFVKCKIQKLSTHSSLYFKIKLTRLNKQKLVPLSNLSFHITQYRTHPISASLGMMTNEISRVCTSSPSWSRFCWPTLTSTLPIKTSVWAHWAVVRIQRSLRIEPEHRSSSPSSGRRTTMDAWYGNWPGTASLPLVMRGVRLASWSVGRAQAVGKRWKFYTLTRVIEFARRRIFGVSDNKRK